MSGDLFAILSYLPESDVEQKDYQVVDPVISFLCVLSTNIVGSGYITSDSLERLDKVFNKMKDTRVLDILYFLLQQYTDIHNCIRLAAVIGNFLCGQEIPVRLWGNVDMMKEGLELFVRKEKKEEMKEGEEKRSEKKGGDKKRRRRRVIEGEKEVSIPSDDVRLILVSLARISMIDSNRERMMEKEFIPLLLRFVDVDDFVLTQYVVVPLGNLSFTFSSDDSRRLVESGSLERENKNNNRSEGEEEEEDGGGAGGGGGLLDIFNRLFQRLTLVTSTLPVPYFALCSCFLVVYNILKTYPPSSDELLKSQLIKTLLNMLSVASSLIISSPISNEIKLFFNRICSVFVFSGVSQENVEALFEIGAVSLVINSLEDIAAERKQSENKDYDEILESLTSVLYDLVVKGFNTPTSSDENGLFNKFDKINAGKKFCDIFSTLKTIHSPSRDVKTCLSYLSLSVFSFI
jgi:hypothetical protein